MLNINHRCDAQIAGYPTIFHNLMVVCLLGAAYGEAECVDTVSLALDMTLTDPRAFHLSRALVQSVGVRSGDAMDVLRAAQAEQPESVALKMALAAGLLRHADPAWRGMVDEVLATSVDPAERAAAQGLLDFGASASG